MTAGLVDGLLTWNLSYAARPWTVNTERGRGGTKDKEWSWRDRAGATLQWRGDFKILAKQAKIPPLRSAAIEVRQLTKTRTRPDPGSIYPAVKAAIDGIVDARVLPDDGPDFVSRLTFFPAEAAGRDELILTITGVPV